MNNRTNQTDNSQNTTKKWFNRIALCGFVAVTAMSGGDAAKAQIKIIDPIPIGTDPSVQIELVSLPKICFDPTRGCGTNTWVAPNLNDANAVASVNPLATPGITFDANRPHKQCIFGCSMVYCETRSVYDGFSAVAPGRRLVTYLYVKDVGCS